MGTVRMTAEAGRVCALSGSSGYVGSIIRRSLEAAGWRVICLTRQSPTPPGQIHWSLTERQPIANDLERHGVTALVHTAWDFTQVRKKDIWRVNVAGSLQLLDECSKAAVRQKIFVSTISAFAGAQSLYGQAKSTVEQSFTGRHGIVVRPGLVYGASPGGMFGNLRKQVKGSKVIPIIGNGSYLQYLVHEDDLALVITSLLEKHEVHESLLTVAHPKPFTFRQLLDRIAATECADPVLLKIPWRLVYAGLKLSEMVGLRLAFRSDSVVSLVKQNPHPKISDLATLGVSLRPFAWP
jgi:nucleoside-diphosphate-sugar epimerase